MINCKLNFLAMNFRREMMAQPQSKKQNPRAALPKVKQRLTDKVIQKAKIGKPMVQHQQEISQTRENEILQSIGRVIIMIKDEDLSKVIISIAEKVFNHQTASEISKILNDSLKQGMEAPDDPSFTYGTLTKSWEENLGLVKETVLEK